MPVSNVVDEQGFLVVGSRHDYEAAVFRETLSGILAVERRNVIAQLMLLAAMVVAASRLPNASFFILPLALRLAAVCHTRFAAHMLGKAIARGGRIERELAYAGFALFAGGATWGYLLACVMIDPTLHPARMVLGGGALVGVSLITSIVAPSNRLLLPFLSGFVGCFALATWMGAAEMFVVGTLAVVCLVLIFLAFAFAFSSQRVLTSRTLVENRMLSEELADSLAHAEFLAYRDPLTGLMNRRAFFEFAAEYDDSALRHVLSIDLDNFKAINDRYGHATGDKVLVKVADSIRGSLEKLPPGRHCSVRLGGEEFAIVMDCADRATACKVTEALRARVEAIAEAIGARDLRTTCSIGLSCWEPGSSIDAVLGNADGLLYRAKRQGRNRVEHVA